MARLVPVYGEDLRIVRHPWIAFLTVVAVTALATTAAGTGVAIEDEDGEAAPTREAAFLDPRAETQTAWPGPEASTEARTISGSLDHAPGPVDPEPDPGSQSVASDDPVTAAVGLGSLLGSGVTMVLTLPTPRTRPGAEEPEGEGQPTGPRFLDTDGLTEGLSQEPVDHPGARGALLLGNEAVRGDKLQAAAAWFEVATQLDPRLGIAYLLKGLVLEEAGHHERGLRAAEEAVRIDPGDAACIYLLARLTARTGQRARARGILAKLRAELPGLPGFVLEDEGFQELHDDPTYLAQIGALDEPDPDTR